MKILFCCIGNTCRSPMAEYIAKKTLKDSTVESAGLIVSAKEANPDTLLVLKEKYGIDASSHVPKKIDETALKDFSFVIALDRGVYDHLKSLVNPSKLQCWDIQDPIGRGYSKYLEVQKMLHEKIVNLI